MRDDQVEKWRGQSDQFLSELKALRWKDSRDYRDFMKEQEAKYGLGVMHEIYPHLYPPLPKEPQAPSLWSRLMRLLSLIHATSLCK